MRKHQCGSISAEASCGRPLCRNVKPTVSLIELKGPAMLSVKSALPLFVVLLLYSAAAAAEPQLAHMVFFRLAEPTDAHREQLVKACHEHLSGHEGTVYFSVGVRGKEFDREVNDREFDVALHMVFLNKAAHDKYQPHPRHLKFISENKHLWNKVRVFDSYVAVKPNKKSPQ